MINHECDICSFREWDERRSERSDRSGRRPRTPLDSLPAPGSPYRGDNFSEEGSRGGTPREYREREARERERGENREFEAREPHTVLPPLPTPGDMEAISDDEDLPDLPPETGEVEEEYQGEDCMDEIGMDDNQQDESKFIDSVNWTKIWLLCS